MIDGLHGMKIMSKILYYFLVILIKNTERQKSIRHENVSSQWFMCYHFFILNLQSSVKERPHRILVSPDEPGYTKKIHCKI